MNRAEIRHWLASGDATTARAVRRTLRGMKRAAARLRSGSVAAEMDRIVLEATRADRGSGLAMDPHEVVRRRRVSTSGPRRDHGR